MNTIYRLFAWVKHEWVLLCSVQSSDPEAALSEAILMLRPDQKQLRLRFEADPDTSIPADCCVIPRQRAYCG